MKWLRHIFILLILGCWFSAMNHCYFEMAGIIPMDECCEIEQTPDHAADSDHSCDDGCKDLEEAGYKLQEKDIHVAPLLLAVLQLPEIENSTLPGIFSLTTSDSKTLYLPQFVIQTALPIRGPSVAS